MFKLFKLMIILIFVTNCSIDTKTGIWENKKDISTDTELSSLSFDENLSFEEFNCKSKEKKLQGHSLSGTVFISFLVDPCFSITFPILYSKLLVCHTQILGKFSQYL